MFRRSRTDKVKETAAGASELAMRLAQDKKFRKRLLSAIKHSSKAGRRTRRGLGVIGAARRFAGDRTLHAELRRARKDLKQAYGRLEAKRRTHKLRRFTLLAGLASLAAFPQLRQRVAAAIASRARSSGSSDSSRPRALDDLTREELYARAQEADIPGRSEMSKQQLVDALRSKS
jgi:hypothetical protein